MTLTQLVFQIEHEQQLLDRIPPHDQVMFESMKRLFFQLKTSQKWVYCEDIFSFRNNFNWEKSAC